MQHAGRDYFDRHVRAGFGGTRGAATSLSVPPWLATMRRRASRQIAEAGLESELRLMLPSFAHESESAALEVFVQGVGNVGKSTLTNALLGSHATTAWAFANTWCMQRFVARPEPTDVVKLFVDDALAHGRQWQARLGAPRSRAFRGLTEYALPSNVASEILRVEGEGYATAPAAYGSPIMEVEREIRAAKTLFPLLRLVDTPGLSQKHMDVAHEIHLACQYERADVVLWVVRGTELMSKATLAAIERAKDYEKPSVLVVTWMDRAELQSASSRAQKREKARAIYGGLVNDVVLLSGRAAFLSRAPDAYEMSADDRFFVQECGAQDAAALADFSGLPDLVDVLTRILHDKHERIRNVRRYTGLRQQQLEWRATFSKRSRELQQTAAALRATADDIDAAYTELTAGVRTAIAATVKEVMADVRVKLPQVSMSTRKQIDALLQLSSVSLRLRLLVVDLNNRISIRFKTVIERAGQSDRAIEHSEWLPQMLTTRSYALLQTQPADAADGSYAIQVSTFRLLGGLYGAADRMLVNLRIEWPFMTHQNEALRAEVFSKIEKQVADVTADVQRRLIERCDGLRTHFAEELQRRTRATGTVEQLLARREQLGTASRSIVVPPVFVEAVVHALRRDGWPRRTPARTASDARPHQPVGSKENVR